MGIAVSDDQNGLAGQLLIAMPSLAGSPFERAVIFLCAHTDDGAMGIVVNHPLAMPSFDELLAQLSISPVPSARQISLLRGGPVDLSRGFVLHSQEWSGEGSLPTMGGVTLTASLDVLKDIAAGDGPEQAMLALGYAGWGPGQLEREIIDNSWLSAPLDAGLVFDRRHDTKWRRALQLLKIDPTVLSQHAGHA